ncbi:MAG: radical SAM protein [Lachnospiraceae bacterium]|nr:radical SAM protein [Lachnospiraceae bacterium]
MDILLKPSKYNFFYKDEQGDYLMCNFFKGTDSFCKINNKNIDRFNEIINRKNILLNREDKFISYLYEKGYLIDEKIDEEFRVKSMYYNTVMGDGYSLTIMPTEQCNFRCKYCYETFEKGKMSKEDQKALLKYIQKCIAHSNRLHISWFGGEPLLAMDVVEYIMSNVQKMCNLRKIHYSSNITTNAYLLDADTFEKLYQFRVTAYQITVDGLKEQHDSQRVKGDGSGTFDRIMKNLISIRDLPKNKYKFANITVRVNVTKNILDRLDEFVKYYDDLFGKDERFNIRFAITDNYGGEQIKDIEDKLVKGKNIYDKLKEKGIYNNNLVNFADAISAFEPMNLVCYAAYKNSFTIGSDLTLYRCTIHFEKSENCLGKILPNGEMEIDTDLNNRWYIKDKLKNPECKECFYLPYCYNVSCPLRENVSAFENKCTMRDYKENLGNYLVFLDKKMKFETI